MEYKTITLPLAKTNSTSQGQLTGYASVFNIKDAQGDIVKAGAFAASLKYWAQQKKLPPLLWQHEWRLPCGTWQKLKEDKIGLYAEGLLALQNPLGQQAFDAVQAGRVRGLSIGYTVMNSFYNRAAKARILTQINLIEISLVTLPANPAARVTTLKSQ